MGNQNRRLAAIMFTDIVGYSALSQRNEDLALTLLGEHRELLEPIFDEFNGVVIKSTGDGYLAEFASAIQSLQCAVAMQKAVHDRNKESEPERFFQIRIGLHVGDIVHCDGDVLGDGVNIASRIEPLAEPGGICISEQVYDHVHNKLELHLINLGPQELKNITVPMEIYRVFLPWEEGTIPPSARFKPKRRTSLTKTAAIALPVLVLLSAIGVYLLAPDRETGDSVRVEGIRTVAVLPFRDLSEEMNTGYFSEGITEELINALTKIEGIRVPARTSAFAYQNSEKNLAVIAKELGVEAVLEGSVRTDGNQFRISARLNDIKNDTLLWSEIFDREMDNIFAVQDEITKKIVQTLKVTLDVDQEKPMVVATTQDIAAYHCYLKGLEAWNDRTREGFEKALACFQNAIEHDPGYAQAYAGLADTFHLMERYGQIPTEEGRKRAKENALKALELDPDLAAARTSLATIFEYEWEWEVAEREFQRAIELEPNAVLPKQWYASLLSKLGRFDEAIRQIEVALPLDPRSPSLNRSYGVILSAAGRDEAATRQLEKTLEMNPEFPGVRSPLAILLAREGEIGEAQSLIQEELDKFEGSGEAEIDQAYIDSLGGKSETLNLLLAGFLNSPTPEENAFAIAMLRAVEPNLDDCFRWLNIAIEHREFDATHLRTIRLFDPIRMDSRYEALLAKMGLNDRVHPSAKS